MNKFHINKHGVPALCRAKSNNCPLGKNIQHFKSKEEAQAYVDDRHKKEFGILPKENVELKVNKASWAFKIARSQKDKNYIETQKKILKKESSKLTYIERCKTSKRLKNYKPNNKTTIHFRDDRADKNMEIEKNFGKGNVVGYYEVNHLVSKISKARYKTQIAEVLDNGQITIYDKYNGKTVTTFMGHRARIEAMMLLAGEIPNNKFLGRVIDNRAKAVKLDLS